MRIKDKKIYKGLVKKNSTSRIGFFLNFSCNCIKKVNVFFAVIFLQNFRWFFLLTFCRILLNFHRIFADFFLQSFRCDFFTEFSLIFFAEFSLFFIKFSLIFDNLIIHIEPAKNMNFSFYKKSDEHVL